MHFWYHKTLQKKWWCSIVISWRFCVFHLQGLHALSTFENIWLLKLTLCECLYVQFPFHIFHVKEVVHALVKKTMDQHVILNLAFTTILFINFDFYMFCNSLDTFVLVTYFSMNLRSQCILLRGYLKWTK